ncbi:hypothetical protein [Thalassotalea mangrovi]|uniref:DUF3887 domain-containing protein n=1 Tax=Thalassotalea mangrovi TaxID=2572245 RepID=A0A4U1B5J8_9GAMM|nr:hypothetical protein [Thalassotalea mangrovi]TKB45724.1 hypothetical protein E8M12_07270 [Thalassotalea mangrovi]
MLKRIFVLLPLLLTSSLALAESGENTEAVAEIPLTADAQVFSRYDDDFPAILTFFSQLSEAEIKSFYNDQLGQPTSEKTVYGRLELKYAWDEKSYRVIIDSLQENHREVDVLVSQ